MRIPKSITAEVIENVIDGINRKTIEIPDNRWGKKYELRRGANKYPPKFLIWEGHRLLTGRRIKGLTGGSRTNNFLLRKGSQIFITS